MVYFFVWLSSLLLFALGVTKSLVRYRAAFARWAVLSLAVISGIRWATGTDWAPYHIFYTVNETFSDFVEYFQFEVGYKILAWLFASLGVPYTGWLFAQALFVIWLKFSPIIRRPYVLICFLVLFGTSMADLFPVRQSMAISIVIYSVSHLVDRRHVSFYLMVLAASLIHFTAIIFFFAPFVLRFSYGVLLVGAALGFVVLYFLFFHVVFAIFTILGIEQIAYLAAAYSQEIEGRVSLLSIGYKVVFLLFVYKVAPLVKEKLNRYELAALKFTVVGVALSIMLESISVVLNRLSIYYYSFEFISASALIYFVSRRWLDKRKYFTFMFFALGVVIFYSVRFVGLFNNYPDLYYPFETVFDSSHKETY